MSMPRAIERFFVYPESVFALGILLFLISLALPGVVTEPLAHKYPDICMANYGSFDNPGCTWGIVPTYFFGAVILLGGWAHLAAYQLAGFAWLANPLALLALTYAKNDLHRRALLSAGAAVLLGLLALVYPSLRFDLAAGESYMRAFVGLGYFFWEAALIVWFIYCHTLYRRAPLPSPAKGGAFRPPSQSGEIRRTARV